MRKLLNKIVGRSSDSDISKLLKDAEQYPRYKHFEIKFRGLNLHVPDFISAAWQLKEIFVDEQMRFESSTETPVIVDCGANVGVSVIYFAKLYPKSKIIAFEPDPKIAEYLERNIKENNIENVEFFKKAVWKNDEGVSFGMDGADGGSVFLEKNKSKIETVRLRDVLKDLAKIEILKMDVEGAEVEILKDCKEELNKIKNIFVEYHSWCHLPQELDVLLNILSSSGFRYYLRSIGENHMNPFVKKVEGNGMDIQLNIHAIKS